MSASKTLPSSFPSYCLLSIETLLSPQTTQGVGMISLSPLLRRKCAQVYTDRKWDCESRRAWIWNYTPLTAVLSALAVDSATALMEGTCLSLLGVWSMVLPFFFIFIIVSIISFHNLITLVVLVQLLLTSERSLPTSLSSLFRFQIRHLCSLVFWGCFFLIVP